MEFREIYSDLNLKEMEENLQNLFPDWQISFSELVKMVYEGEGKGLLEMFLSKIRDSFLGEWKDLKNVFITIVILILIASLFHVFKDIFQNRQIAEISFYINYLILIMIFTNLFGSILAIGEKTLRTMEEFMRIFFPTYFLLVGSTLGVGTGLAYFQVAGMVIYLVEWCLLSFLLPALSAYMLFVLMNGIWEEEKLTLLLELFRKGIKLLLKVMLGILTGAGMVQSMIVPVFDRIRGESVSKAVEMIPGIGEVAEGALRIWLGSAILIKNSIGIVGCVLLIVLCMIPVIRILLTGCILKITAAILSIIGDKKMINCTNQVGDGVFLVLQTVCYGILFFLVLIAITLYTTNGGI